MSLADFPCQAQYLLMDRLGQEKHSPWKVMLHQLYLNHSYFECHSVLLVYNANKLFQNAVSWFASLKIQITVIAVHFLWSLGVRSDPILRGVIPNSFEHIFTHIARTQNQQYLVRASYLEIYQVHLTLISCNHGVFTGQIQFSKQFATECQ